MSGLKRRVEALRKRKPQRWAVITLIEFRGYTAEGRPHVVLREGPEQVIAGEHFGHVGESRDAFIDRMWPDCIYPNLGMA